MTPEAGNVPAGRAPLHRFLRTTTTIECLMTVLQDVVGPDDTRVVAVTCEVLSAHKAAFFHATAYRDLAAWEERNRSRGTPTPVL